MIKPEEIITACFEYYGYVGSVPKSEYTKILIGEYHVDKSANRFWVHLNRKMQTAFQRKMLKMCYQFYCPVVQVLGEKPMSNTSDAFLHWQACWVADCPDGRPFYKYLISKLMINIKKLDKAKILLALWRASREQGNSYMGKFKDTLSLEDCQDIVAQLKGQPLAFDYLNGRVMKVDISGDTFDPWLFDRDNGNGSADGAIDSIKPADWNPDAEEEPETLEKSTDSEPTADE